MTFFSQNEFNTKYNLSVSTYQIEMASEMIFSQVGVRYRAIWDENSCPTVVKNAAMEQLRFMLEHDIPFVDYKDKLKAGDMESTLSSDYSTLALRMLSNGGYTFRGAPINYNMGIKTEF